MRKAVRPLLAVAFGITVAACAEETKFQPAVFSAREEATHPATVYSFRTESGAVGRALVWSPGIYEDAAQPVVDVRVDLQNQTDDPMRFDADHATLAFTTEKNRGGGSTRAFRIEGVTTVPPKSHVAIRTLHSLPRGVKPEDVSAFDFNWTVHTDKGDFGESTAFVQWQPSCCAEPLALYPLSTDTDSASDPGLPLQRPLR